jgi:hypothetical protein
VENVFEGKDNGANDEDNYSTILDMIPAWTFGAGIGLAAEGSE